MTAEGKRARSPHHPLCPPFDGQGPQLGPSPGAGRKLGGWGWARGPLLPGQTGESSRCGRPAAATRPSGSSACGSITSMSWTTVPFTGLCTGQGRRPGWWGGGQGKGPRGVGALTGVPVGVSFCSLRPSAPSLWALQTLPYAVIQAGRHPHLHPPPVTLKSILGGRGDRTIAGDKAEDLCIFGPDAPAHTHSFSRGG